MKWLVKSLLKSLLIGAVFVPFATVMPLASLWLCRTPVGAQVVFWAGPWSACFWALVIHVFVGSKFWRGRNAVLAWRAERGGYLRSCGKSTMVMFGALFASYGLEFAAVLSLPPSATARQLFPLITYTPVAFTFWSAVRG
jgi:hypothetical protein